MSKQRSLSGEPLKLLQNLQNSDDIKPYVLKSSDWQFDITKVLKLHLSIVYSKLYVFTKD